MVDEITTAEIIVNTDRVSGKINGGSPSDTKELKVLKDILKHTKAGAEVANKTLKLGMGGGLSATGLLSKGGILSSLTALVAGAVVAAKTGIESTGRAGGNTWTDEYGNIHDTTGHFQKAIIDGEEKVIEVNEQTGKIVNVLSIREAKERGILDMNNEILSDMLASKGKWDEVLKTQQMQGFTLILSLKELEALLDEEQLAKKNVEEYNRLLKIRNDKLAEQINKQFGGRLSAGNFTSDYTHTTYIDANYMDLVRSREAMLAQQNRAFTELKINNEDNIFPYWDL